MGEEEDIDIRVSIRDELSRPAKKIEKSLEDIEEAARDADREVSNLEDSLDDLTNSIDDSSDAQKKNTQAVSAGTEALRRRQKSTEQVTETNEDFTESTEKATESTGHFRDAQGRLRDEQGRYVRESHAYHRALGKSTVRIKGLGRELRKTRIGVTSFFTGYFSMLSTFKQIIFSDMALMLPQLLTIINTLGAAIVALIGPLGLLASNIAVILPAIATFGLLAAGVSMAFGGIGGAVAALRDPTTTMEELNAAMEGLGPNARRFARELVPVADKFASIKGNVQEAFLARPTRNAITSMANSLFPRLNRALAETGRQLGIATVGMEEAFNDPKTLKALEEVLDRGAQDAGIMAGALGEFLRLMIHITNAAGPQFTRFLIFISDRMGELADRIANDPEGLANFFERAGDMAAGFAEGVGHLFRGLRNLARAAKPLSDFVTGGMREGLKNWADWLGMDETQMTLGQYFEDMIPNLEAVGKLFGALWDAFMDIGTSEFFTEGIDGLIIFIGYFADLIKRLDEGLTPAFADLAEAIGLVTEGNPASIVDPLIWVFQTLADVVGFLAPLFADLSPEVKTVVTWMAGLAAIGVPVLGFLGLLFRNLMPIFKIVGWISRLLGKGVGGLWGLLFGKKGKGGAPGKAGMFSKILDPLKKLFTGGGLKAMAKVGGKTLAKGLLSAIPGVGLVIAAVWTFIDVVIWAYEEVEWFGDVVDGVFQWIGDLWGGMVNGIKDLWNGVLYPVIEDIGEWFVWLWEDIISPVLGWIGDRFGGMVNGIKDLWNGVLKPVFDGIGAVFTWLWEKIIQPIFYVIQQFWILTVDVLVWFWENYAKPMFEDIGEALGFLWNVKVKPTFDNIGNLWGGMINGMRDLWNGVLWPTIQAVGAFLVLIWLTKIKPVFDKIGSLWGGMINGIRDYWNSHLKPVFDNVGKVVGIMWNVHVQPTFNKIGDLWGGMINGIRDLWNSHLKPVFQAFMDFVSIRVVGAFESAVDTIIAIWSTLKKGFATPINWVIDTVINKGIVDTFNTVAGVVGSEAKLHRIGLIPTGDAGASKAARGRSAHRGSQALYTGGMLDNGGYTGPGGKYLDKGTVHAGEYVIKRDATFNLMKTIGRGGLDYMNETGKMPGYAVGGLVRPVNGPISSRFGAGRGRYPHAGVDYAVPVGTPVRAPGDGVVERAGNNILSGRTGLGSLIAHSNGLKSYVGHLSQILAGVGQSVKQGQIYARSGNTGNSTGPHVHFEIHQNGQAVDPLGIVPGGQPTGMGGTGGGFLWDLFTSPLQAIVDGIGSKVSAALGGHPMAQLATGVGVKVGREVIKSIPGFIGSIGDSIFGGGGNGGSPGAKDAVRDVASGYGWGGGSQWSALSALIQRESGWDTGAANPRSSARGLFQKMTSLHGAIEGTAAGQARWGLNYIKGRYGSPSSALAYHNANGHYSDGGMVKGGIFDTGGWLMPGQVAMNMSDTPEPILNGEQFGWIKSIAASAERAYSHGLDGVSVAGGRVVAEGQEAPIEVKVFIEKVESDVDIEKAVAAGIRKARQEEKERR